MFCNHEQKIVCNIKQKIVKQRENDIFLAQFPWQPNIMPFSQLMANSCDLVGMIVIFALLQQTFLNGIVYGVLNCDLLLLVHMMPNAVSKYFRAEMFSLGFCMSWKNLIIQHIGLYKPFCISQYFNWNENYSYRHLGVFYFMWYVSQIPLPADPGWYVIMVSFDVHQ